VRLERELIVRCSKSGNRYTMAELTTLEATDAHAMAMATPITVHYTVGLALRSMNEHPFGPFYGSRGEQPNAMAVRLELERVPEGDMNKLARRYQEVFGLQFSERGTVVRKEGGVCLIRSQRHGHEYEFAEMNAVRSGDAMSMALGVGNPMHYRMAFALKKIDGQDVPYQTKNTVVRGILKHIPLSDTELLNEHYNAEFASGDDDDDLGNEFALESRGLDSSTSESQPSSPTP
jgi:hypothetical protein